MSDTTIEWTDKTWNPVTGCTKVSEGCRNCYAERVFPRAYGKDRKFTDVRCHPERLEQPLHWRKPQRIFVNSMSDLFHEDAPFEFILEVFRVMGAAFWHRYQILTKRPERMLEVIPQLSERLRTDGRAKFGPVWKHVHLGVSVEDQKTADARIPLLLQTPAAVRFVSVEPMLSSIDLKLDCIDIAPGYADTRGFLHRSEMLHPCDYACGGIEILGGIDWVIVGGESGSKARPCNLQWIRDVIEQCRAAGVACFVKQLGTVPIDPLVTCKIDCGCGSAFRFS